MENRQDPCQHFKYRFPRIKYPRQTKTVASYTFPSTVKDYSRNVGVPSVLKIENAQSEVGKTCCDHCHHHCIKQETTEPDHPWQNPAEPKIGQLNSMINNVIKKFDVPLKEHDW
eukprot:8602254-Ditylum_brightwellii.AAC.1